MSFGHFAGQSRTNSCRVCPCGLSLSLEADFFIEKSGITRTSDTRGFRNWADLACLPIWRRSIHRYLGKEKFVGKYKLNKKVVVISSLDETDEKDYWKSRTPTDRLKAIETNRRIVYGYAHTSPRFQSFFEVAQLQKN